MQKGRLKGCSCELVEPSLQLLVQEYLFSKLTIFKALYLPIEKDTDTIIFAVHTSFPLTLVDSAAVELV